MFQSPQSLDDIVHIIQVALTPVFLLSGIASLLAVFAARLGRVADKVDALTDSLDRASLADRAKIHTKLAHLRHRSRTLDAAVVLGALAGISTSGAALLLFVSKLRNGTGSALMFLAFGAALVCTIGALSFFLIEMLLASRGIRALAADEKTRSEEIEPAHPPEPGEHGAETNSPQNDYGDGGNVID